MNITCITFCLLTTAHLLEIFFENRNENIDHYSPWILEKWCILFFEFALSFECLITVFYWGFLYNPSEDIEKPINDKIINFFDHAIPMTILLIGFFLN